MRVCVAVTNTDNLTYLIQTNIGTLSQNCIAVLPNKQTGKLQRPFYDSGATVKKVSAILLYLSIIRIIIEQKNDYK